MKILFISSAKKNMAALRHAIMGIIGSRPKEKMAWPNAITNITFMKNALSFWDIPFVNHPRVSVGQNPFSMVNNDPVASYRERPFPEPARIRFFDMAKQSVFGIAKRLFPARSASETISMICKRDFADRTGFHMGTAEPIIPCV